MIAKVENYCMRNLKARVVHVDESERACVNCIWYEPYYRRNRSNVGVWQATSTGYCRWKKQRRGALRQTCEKFEQED